MFKLGKERSLVDEGYRALIIASLYEGAATVSEINSKLVSEFDLQEIHTHILNKYLNDLIKERKVLLSMKK